MAHDKAELLFFLVIYLFSEYHLHQTFNQMSGHVCVAGDRATVNEQMPSQWYILCSILLVNLWSSYQLTCSCFVFVLPTRWCTFGTNVSQNVIPVRLFPSVSIPSFRNEKQPKCVPQFEIVTGDIPVSYWTILPLSLVTVPEVCAKVNSACFPWPVTVKSHNYGSCTNSCVFWFSSIYTTRHSYAH